MKTFVEKKFGILKLICALVLCAGIAILVVTCEKDDCKTCTHNVTKEVGEFCGTDLVEAELNPALTCK